MGPHKHKKKYESESSSSESEASSSSSDSRSKGKKPFKKSRQSSSEESYNEKTSKSKSKRSSDDSDSEKTKKKMRLTQETVDRSSDHKHKEKEHRPERNKDEKYEERHKDKYNSGDTDRLKNRGKSRDRDIDESRNRRDSNNRERYEDRNKKQDYRRDDRRSFRYQGNSRDYRDNNRDRKSFNRRENRGRRSSSFDHANAKWGKNDEDAKSEKKPPQEKEKPNFGLSGKLTEETNTFKGIVIKYSEPPEARKPRRRWRLYPFKGEKALQTLYIHRESAYLIGRERKVVDLPADHPSCSKQHAALQYRLVPFTREDGSSGKRVRPYLIDLESANGTFINNKKIESKKYVELFEKDVIKFGFSSREYVLLHENSKDEAMDDDVKQEEEEIPIKEEPE